MKFISKIEGAVNIDKSSQRKVNGGRPVLDPSFVSCAVACASPSATHGQKCGVGTHCPGVCDGNGGFWAY